jgi:hypothetical protein
MILETWLGPKPQRFSWSIELQAENKRYLISRLCLLCLGILFFLCGPKVQAIEASDTLIVPGTRVGAITKSASYDSLRKLYGDRQVTPHLVEMGEGFVCHGSRISFEDGDSLELTWADSAVRAGVTEVHINGQRWQTKDGLRFAMTLAELERLNGQAFTLTGFGWDYGGTVLSWNGGALERTLPQNSDLRILVRLGPDPGDRELVSAQEWAQVSGDRDFSSAHPVMQKLNPRIYNLTVTLSDSPRCKEFFP